MRSECRPHRLSVHGAGGVVSAAAFGAFTSIAPGSWLEIYGSNLAADSDAMSNDQSAPGDQQRGFTRVSVSYEIHQLGDAVIHSPILLRLFSRGNLTITGQQICLSGIRKPEAVRDLLRNAGQGEAQRMDKVRWR
jgi:hypothetical protein